MNAVAIHSPALHFVQVAMLAVLAGTTLADDFPWLDPTGIEQALLVSFGPPASDVRERFAALAKNRAEQTIVLSLGTTDTQPSVADLPYVLWFSGSFESSLRSQIADALSRHPDRVAICLEEQAALAITGRELHSLSEGKVHLALAASPGRAFWHTEMKAGERHDLTMLRRGAIERSRGDFPPVVLPQPEVPIGSLVICGGGSLPNEVMDTFLELAGGRDAKVVVLPIAAGDTLPEDSSNDTRPLKRAGATHVQSLRARTLAEVSSPEFAKALSQAKGVWFSGGRQWRFVDAYLGTPAQELLAGVLARGGVIGGTSAGASIQAQYMPRGSPLGNADMMAEGYERGLGFLPSVAIDQHFTARRRHADMQRLVERYPQLLGIGIDESTALIVRGSTAQILGRGSVFFYDYRTGRPATPQDYVPRIAGQSYNLLTRQPLP